MIRFHFNPDILEPITSTRHTVDPVPELIARLKDVEETKSGWQCRCPSHEDDTASLSVSRGDDGRALVFCHAGCSAESICQALGWTLADLMPASNGRHDAKPKQAKKPVAMYDYTDEDGFALFQVVRYEPKDFRQRKPDGNGGWLWSVKGVRVVPFHLEQLTADPGRTVVVVEGEKDVENLEKIGVLATCNAGGAGKWTPEHADYLAGRNILIIPDNDEPGRKHAQAVAESVADTAKSIRIVELPGLHGKGQDVSDWISAGGTREQLLELAKAAPAWPDKPEPPPTYKPETATKKPPRRIEVVHAREFAAHDYHPSWLVRRVLVAGQPAICGGRSKAMKTSNMVDLAVSIGTGTPFLGHFDTARQTVALLSGESGAFTIQETAQRVANARSVSLADADVYFGFNLPQISRAPDILATIDMINQTGSRVVIIDPAYLCTLTIGDRRQSSNVFDMGSILVQLTEIGERTGATIIMCHHCRKGPGEGRDRYDPPDLEELSMAGFAEWARQWILIGRREAFEAGTGHHKLWLNVGGSVGFSGCWSVDIDEGVIRDDFTGRVWEVSVGTIDDANAEKESLKEKRETKKREKLEWRHQRQIIQALRLEPAGMTRNQIRDATGMNSQRMAAAIFVLRQKQTIKAMPGTIRGKECELLLLSDSARESVDENDELPPDDNPYKGDFDAYK